MTRWYVGALDLARALKLLGVPGVEVEKAVHSSQTPTFGRRTPLERLVRAVVGRAEASVTNRTAPVAFSRPVASQRCPSRPTWARVAPTYSRTKCEAPEPEAGAEQGAAQKLRHGASGTLHESGE